MGFFDIIEKDIRDYRLESEIKTDFQLITWLARNTKRIYRIEEKRLVFLANKKQIKKFKKLREVLKEHKYFYEQFIILDNIETISYRTGDAYTSQLIKKGEKGEFHFEKVLKTNLETIKKDAIYKYLLIKEVDEDYVNIIITYDDLLNYFKVDEMRYRRYTGKQFRVTVRKINESKGKTYRFGVFILEEESCQNVKIYQANAQGSRPHKLSKQEHLKLKLPDGLWGCEFYKTTKK